MAENKIPLNIDFAPPETCDAKVHETRREHTSPRASDLTKYDPIPAMSTTPTRLKKLPTSEIVPKTLHRVSSARNSLSPHVSRSRSYNAFNDNDGSILCEKDGEILDELTPNMFQRFENQVKSFVAARKKSQLFSNDESRGDEPSKTMPTPNELNDIAKKFESIQIDPVLSNQNNPENPRDVTKTIFRAGDKKINAKCEEKECRTKTEPEFESDVVNELNQDVWK